MKLFDIDGNLVNVDVRESSHPAKAKSRSSLQGIVGQRLREKYPYDAVLEDWTIPGSRMSLDFFIPKKKLAWEIDGEQHRNFIPHFHGDIIASTKFVNQLKRDDQKTNWCEINNITLVRINSKEDLELLDA